MTDNFRLRVALYALLMVSVILHEVSHGWSALALGDDTAKRAGRLSLNPLVHVDPLGTIVLPAILILSNSGVLFGWAKPVPVNTARLRHPRNGAVITGLAGPAMNLVLMGLALVALRQVHPQSYWPTSLLFYFGLTNVWLALFNLLPVPPLDGSSVVERFIPEKWWGPYLSIRPYTLPLVFAIVILGSYTGFEGRAYQNVFTWWLGVTGYA